MIRPILALAVATVAFPALAQIGQGAIKRERYVQIREGERCPRSEDPEEVVVCGVTGENDRFRIPEQFREASPEDAQSGEGRAAEAQAAGDSGTLSCSAAGPGGFTGCAGEEYARWRAERKNQRVVRNRSVDD